MAGFHRELSTASSCINHPFVCGTRPQARDQHQRKLIMPEFEESEATNSSKENYTPSTDATKKPRTRRRSGGFKTEYKAPTSAAEIGEVDAAKALKSEKLSGGAKPDAEPTKERRAPRADKPARRAEKPEQRSEPRAEKPAPRISNAKPSTETLAAKRSAMPNAPSAIRIAQQRTIERLLAERALQRRRRNPAASLPPS